MALKERELCRRVVGLVRRSPAAQEAERLGVVDKATLDPGEALPQADLVVFSTPVRVIILQMIEYGPLCKAGAVITDMGSTKQAVVQAMADLPEQIHPVGSHPMCGKEKGGLGAAEASLYRDAPWILTPLPRTPPPALQLVRDLAEAVGARPYRLAADRHDKLVAAISHLPYTLAASLVLATQRIAEEDPAVWEVAASGFKDTSRVAASDVTMMLDILLTNPEAVRRMLAIAQDQLDRFSQALAAGDEAALRRLMEQAAQQRQALWE